MFVRDDHRRRGLARALLHALERSASAAGADWMILETGAPQVEALALYRAHGYTEVDPVRLLRGRALGPQSRQATRGRLSPRGIACTA